MYRLFILLLLFATVAGVASAQQPIVGQPCGAAGVSSIATNGQAVQCQGSPLIWVATGGGGGGAGTVTNTNGTLSLGDFIIGNGGNDVKDSSFSVVPSGNGGTGVASPTAHGIAISEGTAPYTFVCTSALTGQLVTVTNALDPSCKSPGVIGTDVNSASYTVQCDSGTTLIDRASTLRFITTAPTVTMPDPTAAGCGGNFIVTIIASGVPVTVNRTTTAVFNVYNGGTSNTGLTTFSLVTGQYATISSPDNANWLVRIAAGGSGTAYGTGAGTAQAQTVTTVPVVASLTAGIQVCWKPAAANTGAAPTLAVGSLAATAITKFGTVALIANDITTTAIACVIYDGTQYELQNPQAGAVYTTSVGTGAPPAITVGTGGLFACTEGTNPTATANVDIIGCNSANHDLELSNNNGTFFHVAQTIASGTAAMTTAAITAGNCSTTVTVSATNVATTDTITWAFNAAPAGSNAGIVAWPTANNVNFAYCSNTAQTPAAATINWRVVR